MENVGGSDIRYREVWPHVCPADMQRVLAVVSTLTATSNHYTCFMNHQNDVATPKVREDFISKTL